MKRAVTKLLAATLICVGATAVAQENGPVQYQSTFSGPRLFSGSIFTGYSGGVGLLMAARFSDIAQDFPFDFRIGFSVTRLDPGNAVQAHEVFIAEDPDGDPRDRGTIWDARIDLMYPIEFFSIKRTFAYGGPRYSDFDAYFEYIGGAETFDVSTTQWGIGGGLETSFPMSPRVDLLVNVGADYFFETTMDGHDTYYRPNGDNENAIENYTFADADAAINQPRVISRVMVGIGYHF